MSRAFKIGDTVRCVDSASRNEWAQWYGDDEYSEDMLTKGRLYLVLDTLERDGQFGINIGIPTPWGDPFWNADRFEKSLLRVATRVHESAAPNGGDAHA